MFELLFLDTSITFLTGCNASSRQLDKNENWSDSLIYVDVVLFDIEILINMDGLQFWITILNYNFDQFELQFELAMNYNFVVDALWLRLQL